MAADMNLLRGEVVENPKTQELEIEALLAGFLRALLDEQKPEGKPAQPIGRGET